MVIVVTTQELTGLFNHTLKDKHLGVKEMVSQQGGNEKERICSVELGNGEQSENNNTFIGITKETKGIRLPLT